MEMQTLLIGLACCILSAVIVYLISMFSMGEKTFEEVMKEQRIRQEEEQKKARTDKKAERGDKKKYKKFKEKNKGKALQSKSVKTVSTSEINKTSKNIYISEYMASELPPGAPAEVEKPLKQVKNQEKEVSSMPLVATKSINGPSSLVKNDLKSSSPRKVINTTVTINNNNTPSKSVSGGQPNLHLNNTATKPENDQPKPQKKRSAKVDVSQKVVELENTSQKLGANGIQAVNSKPLESSGPKIEKKKTIAKAAPQVLEKNKPPEPEPIKVEKQKKLNSEKVDSPTTKKVSENGSDKVKTESDAKKLKELNNSLRDLQKDKTRLNAENNKLKEALKLAENQCATFNVQLQEIKSKVKTESDAKKLKELNNSLRDLQKDKTRLNAENNKLKEALKLAENQCATFNVQLQEIKSKQDVDNTETLKAVQKQLLVKTESDAKKLKELNNSLRDLQKDKTRLNAENNKLKEALKLAENQCASFNVQLQDLYKEIKSKDADNSEKIKTVEKELLMMKKENITLKESGPRLKNSLPIEMAPNGDVEDKFTCTKISFVEHEKLLGEKSSEIMRLTSELATRNTEATARVEEKDNEIKALTCKLNNNIQEFEALKEEIKVWHTKNDDLRKKNWKAMEALNNAEASTEKQIAAALKTAEMQTADSFSHDRKLLKNIFPDIVVDEKLEHSVWMKTFEQKAIEILKSKTHEPVSNLQEMSKNVELFEKKLDETMKESTELATKLKYEKDLQIKISDKLKESETKFIELQSTYEIKLTELSTELSAQRDKYSELERMYGDLQSDTKYNDCENNSQDLVNDDDSLNNRLTEAIEDKAKLESKLKEYQNLFLITDEKLQILQKSVEDEEKKWKLHLAQAEKEIQILKEKQNSIEYLESRVSEQQTIVEENEKKNKDLAQTIAKLNGIIKTGQDALAQEQKLVENLKEKLCDQNSLESNKLSQTPDIANNDIGTSV